MKAYPHQDQTDQGERERRNTPVKNSKTKAWQPYSQPRDPTQAQKKGTTVTERGSKREWHRPKLARPTNKPDGKEKPSRNSEMDGQCVRTIKPPRNKRFDSSASAKHRTRAHHHWELREKNVHQPRVQRNTSYIDKTAKVVGADLEQ